MKDWKEKLIEDNFVYAEDPNDVPHSDQIIDGKWYAPKFGCDTVDALLDDVQSLLTQQRENDRAEFVEYLAKQCEISQIENEMRFGDGTGSQKPNYEHVVNRVLLRYSPTGDKDDE